MKIGDKKVMKEASQWILSDPFSGGEKLLKRPSGSPIKQIFKAGTEFELIGFTKRKYPIYMTGALIIVGEID